MRKEIPISEFADELVKRIENAKTIDCCKEEIKNLAALAKKEIGDKMITVEWKD